MAVQVRGEIRKDKNTIEGVASNSMLIGAAQRDFDAFNTLLINTGSKAGAVNGGMQVRRTYDNNMPTTFSSCAASADISKGVASMWSFSNTGYIPDIAAGTYNSQLTTFFSSIPAGHTFYAIFWHEVDLHYRTFSTYQAAYVNIHAALANSTADQNFVKVGGLLTSGGFRNGDGPSYFVQGNHDFIGIDAYEFWRPPGSPPDPKANGLGSQRTPAYLMGDAVNLAIQFNVPLLVGEYGIHPFASTDDPAGWRPTRLNTVINYLDANNCVAFSYFHSDAGESGPWWLTCFPNWTTPADQSSSDPDSVTAYRNIIAAHGG